MRMLPVKELIERGFGGKGLPDGCAMFGGTFAAKGGIRPASRFEFELEDPVLKRKISHGYDVIDDAGAGLMRCRPGERWTHNRGSSLRGAVATKQSIYSPACVMDCFASLAMTADGTCRKSGGADAGRFAKLPP